MLCWDTGRPAKLSSPPTGTLGHYSTATGPGARAKGFLETISNSPPRTLAAESRRPHIRFSANSALSAVLRWSLAFSPRDRPAGPVPLSFPVLTSDFGPGKPEKSLALSEESESDTLIVSMSDGVLCGESANYRDRRTAMLRRKTITTKRIAASVSSQGVSKKALRPMNPT